MWNQCHTQLILTKSFKNLNVKKYVFQMTRISKFCEGKSPIKWFSSNLVTGINKLPKSVSKIIMFNLIIISVSIISFH